jgi:DNA polymerase-4
MLIACFYIPQFGIAVERSRLNHLWGKPVGLSGADDKLVAISDEASPFGIKIGQTASGAKGLCERLIVLPYDRPSYEEAAHLIWDLYAIESSIVQPSSPEVCYVELKSREARVIAERLSRQLAANVRAEAYVGMAQTKFVALQAAKLQVVERGREVERERGRKGEGEAKPCSSQIYSAVLDPSRFLAALPVSLVSHLPEKVLQNLQRMGIRTFRDLQKIPSSELKRRFGSVGLALERLSHGEDNDPIKPIWPPRRLEENLIFEDETVDTGTIHEALRRCSEEIADTLHMNHEYCRSVTLAVNLADGRRLQQREKLAEASHTTAAVHRASLRLLMRMDIQQPILGIFLHASDLGTGSGIQLALLDQNRHGRDLPHERQRALDATTAILRKKFGVGTIIPAVKMLQSKRISLWTYPLGHQENEPIQVETDQRGRPVRFWRNGQARVVKRIQDSWRETEWFWGSISETTVYRVETDSSGLCELHLSGKSWRLCAMAD